MFVSRQNRNSSYNLWPWSQLEQWECHHCKMNWGSALRVHEFLSYLNNNYVRQTYLGQYFMNYNTTHKWSKRTYSGNGLSLSDCTWELSYILMTSKFCYSKAPLQQCLLHPSLVCAFESASSYLFKLITFSVIRPSYHFH